MNNPYNTKTIFKKTIDGLVNRVEMNINHKYTRGAIKTVRTYNVFIGCDPIFGVTQHGDLTRFHFTNKSEALKYAKNTTVAESESKITVKVIHRATKAMANKIGIHLKDADQFSFQDALEVAGRDMFPAIYIHSYARK